MRRVMGTNKGCDGGTPSRPQHQILDFIILQRTVITQVHIGFEHNALIQWITESTKRSHQERILDTLTRLEHACMYQTMGCEGCMGLRLAIAIHTKRLEFDMTR
jgi:hypothetical protein